MAKLLSDSDFDEIRSVLNDVQDTFYQRTVVYKMDTNTVTRWMKDIASERTYVDKTLNGQVVWGTSQGKSDTEKKQEGTYDPGEGYVLLKYDDMLLEGLIDADTALTVTSPQDRIKFDNIVYYITSVVKVGQLKDKEVLVKVFFCKNPKPNT